MSVVPVDLMHSAEAEDAAETPQKSPLGPALLLAGAALAILVSWIGFFLFLVPAMVR